MLTYIFRTFALLSVVVLFCNGFYEIGIAGGLGRTFDGIGGLSAGVSAKSGFILASRVPGMGQAPSPND